MVVLLIPIHTSEVERGFSLMNRVKQDWRARLTNPTLNELLHISLLGPTCNEFEPMEAITLWWKGGRRARRPQDRQDVKMIWILVTALRKNSKLQDFKGI